MRHKRNAIVKLAGTLRRRGFAVTIYRAERRYSLSQRTEAAGVELAGQWRITPVCAGRWEVCLGQLLTKRGGFTYPDLTYTEYVPVAQMTTAELERWLS